MTPFRKQSEAACSPIARHQPQLMGRLTAICLIAVSLLFWCGQPVRADNSHDSGAPAVPVETTKALTADVPVYVEGLGAVQAFNTVTIKTQVNGALQKVVFTEGQDVKQGDLLAVIDPRPYQAVVDQAAAKIQQDQADLANAQYLLSKDQTLEKQSVATEETVESQQSQVNSSVAQLAEDKAAKEAADVSLSYTQIRSPIAGRTGIRLIDAGNQVHTTDANGIVVITQTQPISVLSTLQEGELDAVRQALASGPVEVIARSSDRSKKLATGTLSLIDNEIDQNSGTIRIKSTFENSDNALWPGQFVTLQVREKTIENAVTVPSSALQRGPDGFFVYLVNGDNTVSVRKVTPGQINEGRAVISSGLKTDDTVVTQGQYRLQDGAKIIAASTSAASTETKGD